MKDTFINCARELTIAVIGDVMLDVYVDGTVERLSSEAPNCIVLDETQRTYAIGGAANVAHNLAHFGVKTRLCGTLGTAENDFYHMVLADRIKQVCESKMFGSLEFFPVVETGTRMTTVKKRFLSAGQQLLRVDREHRHPVRVGKYPDDGGDIGDAIKRCCYGADAVIISDYAKGMISDEVLAYTLATIRDLGIPYFVDPKRKDFLDYAQVGGVMPDAICPNYDEWQRSKQRAEPESMTAAGMIIVTNGRLGCMQICFEQFLSHWVEKHHKLQREVHVADPAGAGDTFIAALTVALLAQRKNGAYPSVGEACQIANCLASLTVSEHGIVLPDLMEAGLLIGEEVPA
jgi:D-beta-D-heptose 7-phosphate kinase/D-beta-D-heptose 1-phosphate adenosyltransferase